MSAIPIAAIVLALVGWAWVLACILQRRANAAAARRLGRALDVWQVERVSQIYGYGPRPVDTDMAEWVPEEDRTETS